MPLRTNNAEGGTNGTAVTTGNSGGTSGNAWDTVSTGSGGTITYTSTTPLQGSLSYLLTPSSTNLCYLLMNDGTTGTGFTVSFLFRMTGLPAAENILLAVQTAAGATVARVQVDATGHIKMINSAGSWVATMTAAMSTNTTYKITFFGSVGSSSAVTAKLYDSTGTLIESLARTGVNTGTTNAGRVVFGKFTATTMAAFRVDDWQQNMESSAELTGAVTVDKTQDDTAGGTDAITVGAYRTAADTAGATDSATQTTQTVRAPADTAGGTDSLAVAVTKALADTAAGTDSALIGTVSATTAADTADGTDSVSTGLTLSVTVNDTATARDTDADQVIDFDATTGDEASAGDATSDLAAGSVQVDDTADGSDATATEGYAYVTVADTADGSDVLSGSTVFAVTVSDTAAGSDAITRGRTALPADTAGATDSATTGAVTPTSAADTAGATDATTRAVGIVLADTAGGSDSAITATARVTALDDTAAATDLAIGSLSGATAASIPDTASATDDVTRTTSQLAAQADNAAATDAVTAAATVTPGLGDSAAAGDIVVAVITREQVLAEFAAGSDAISIEYVRAGDTFITDTIAGFDVVEVGLDRLVEVADAAAASDLVTTQVGFSTDGHPVASPRLQITTRTSRLELTWPT